jgi:cytochrome bd-type quinol oxidase subunit 2|tara:strand:+ start:1547 stop:1984 length:438 start_codon:yes stop_codon:yes gene_type:complete
MEEPLRTVIAGMIGGALMGMIFVTHLALLLVYNPPKALAERAVESSVSSLITMSALVTFLGWNVLAIIMAFAAEATRLNDSTQISIAPSPTYLFAVLFVVLFISIPAFIFFRDRKQHLLGEILVFIGIFGFLIPNLVVAIQRSQI